MQPQPASLQFTLGDVAHSLAKAIDRVSPTVQRHHLGVAYMAIAIARRMGIAPEHQMTLLQAALLHDVGALSLAERLDLLEFETRNTQHAEVGYKLIRTFSPLAPAAEIIRYHHAPFTLQEGLEGAEIPLGSRILALADRVDVLIDREEEPLRQGPIILKTLRPHVGSLFAPEAWEAFQGLAPRESFWLDAVNNPSESVDLPLRSSYFKALTWEELDGLAIMLSRVIDFRSRFTSTHSAGVSAVATALAQEVDMSDTDVQQITVAGYFHDLGKIAIPGELLLNPGKLSNEEFNVVKSHTYHTKRILDPLQGLETVIRWGAYHHERLNGMGYPFRYASEELDLGCRIMAVADVFTALAEDRPYRSGMSRTLTMDTLFGMVEEGGLDREVAVALVSDYDKVDGIRRDAQAEALARYEALAAEVINMPC